MDDLLSTLEQQGLIVVVDREKTLDALGAGITEQLQSPQLPNLISRAELRKHRQEILDRVQDVLADPFVRGAAPNVYETAAACATRLSELAVHLDVDMTVKDLREASDLGSKLYNCLEKIAKETRDVDHMTGLRRKNYFESVLDLRIKEYFRNPGKDFSLLFVDLNDLSEINHKDGYEQADILLGTLASILKNSTQDLWCRTGGDEYGAILSNADADGARGLAERVKKLIDANLRSKAETACRQELGRFSTCFDRYVVDEKTRTTMNYTCSIGATSSYLPEQPLLFERLYEHFNRLSQDDSADAQAHRSPHFDSAFAAAEKLANADDPADGLQSLRGELSPEQQQYLITQTRLMLLAEISSATDAAKAQKDGLRSYISVYDAGAQEQEYSRKRSGTSRFFK